MVAVVCDSMMGSPEASVTHLDLSKNELHCEGCFPLAAMVQSSQVHLSSLIISESKLCVDATQTRNIKGVEALALALQSNSSITTVSDEYERPYSE